MIVWDGLQAHRSRKVRDYVASSDGDLKLEFLPPYAPELNPVEQIWNYGKNRELANFCPADITELRGFARRGFRRMQRRPTLIAAFWKQTELVLQCHCISEYSIGRLDGGPAQALASD